MNCPICHNLGTIHQPGCETSEICGCVDQYVKDELLSMSWKDFLHASSATNVYSEALLKEFVAKLPSTVTCWRGDIMFHKTFLIPPNDILVGDLIDFLTKLHNSFV